MFKFFLLTSTKFKTLFFIVLLLAPFIIGFIFIYINYIKPALNKGGDFSIAYRYTPAHDLNISSNSLVFTQSDPFLDKNQNLLYVRCITNKQKTPLLDSYICEVVTKDYYDNEVSILKVSFQNVSEYFGECIDPFSNKGIYQPKFLCDYSKYKNQKEIWFKEKVLKNSRNFVKDIYNLVKHGPELRLLDSFNISRGLPLPDNESKKKGVFGSYVNIKNREKKINVYISDANDKTTIDQNYFQAIIDLKGNTSTYSRNWQSLKQTFIDNYGKHLTTFNKYSGRNKRFDKTITPSNNIQSNFFQLVLSNIKKGFGNSREKQKNAFIRLLVLANKNEGTVSSSEIDEAINIFQNAIYLTVNGTRKKHKLLSLIDNQIKEKFFKNCSAEKTFSYRGLGNIPEITSVSRKGEKSELYLRIREWFSIEKVVSDLYVILTSKTPAKGLTSCPDLLNDEYNYLNYYLSFKLFGFDPYLSISVVFKAAELIFYNVWNWNTSQLDVPLGVTKGILISQNVDEESIDDTLPLSKISKTEKISFFTNNNKIFYRLCFIMSHDLKLHKNKRTTRYSMFQGVKGLGTSILPFDWNNIMFKREFLSNSDREFNTLKNSISAYISSFTLEKGDKRMLSKGEESIFIFRDRNPSFLSKLSIEYKIGEKQIFLDILPVSPNENE